MYTNTEHYMLFTHVSDIVVVIILIFCYNAVCKGLASDNSTSIGHEGRILYNRSG